MTGTARRASLPAARLRLGLPIHCIKVSKRRRFAAALLPRLFGNNVPGHTTRAPPVGSEQGTNGFQFYAIPVYTAYIANTVNFFI